MIRIRRVLFRRVPCNELTPVWYVERRIVRRFLFWNIVMWEFMVRFSEDMGGLGKAQAWCRNESTYTGEQWYYEEWTNADLQNFLAGD